MVGSLKEVAYFIDVTIPRAAILLIYFSELRQIIPQIDPGKGGRRAEKRAHSRNFPKKQFGS